MPSRGPIPEAQCNVEDLEQANDSQLYTILKELKQTQFFRNFEVDLDSPCPLQKKVTTTTNKPEPKKLELTTPAQKDEPGCASEGLPDMDEDSEPACHVQADDPFGGGAFGGGSTSGFGTSSAGFTSGASFGGGGSVATPPQPKVEEKQPSETDTVAETTTIPDSAEASSSDDEDSEESGYDCATESNTEDLDMDEDAEPLCHLSAEHRPTLTSSLISMALETIRYLGWESQSQKETYDWKQHSNPVVGEVGDNTDESCPEDEFWMDMCSSNILKGTKVVNLVLNPERNTGYNGTHIWNAMYEENCVTPQKEENMCYEERVLYRLLSGLHTSTTLSIAKHYFPPSKRKNRVNWEPNPSLFWNKFKDNPEHLRNLHFSYVVLLRALRKASTFLYDYDIRTGNIVEDETATILLRRLLDSAILNSCQPVFSAFDESLMFQEQQAQNETSVGLTLQQSFKGVFQNVSSILDCVQCQQCKLHAKLTVLGYGTALKILFVKHEQSLIHHLTTNEIVAFINTIAKFSESMKEVRDLTQLYWESQQASSVPAAASAELRPLDSTVDLVDATMGLLSKLSREGKLDTSLETQLMKLTMQRNDDLLLLAKHYHMDADKWLEFAVMALDITPPQPDAIVVGSGLAGLAASLNILDRGGQVVIVEKEHRMGGNSNKASSGINACCPPANNTQYGDLLEAFQNDTTRSAGISARPDLIQVLVSKSAEAVAFLKNRAGVDLSLMAQLGGHSYKRTHRPSNGMAGAEIIYGMQKAVKQYEKAGKVKILVDTRVTSLVTDSDRVVGVTVQGLDGSSEELLASNVVLATGGFAADRSHGSYLSQYRPELLNMPATAGGFSTGDGVTLAKTLGAGTVDMDKVQIHPTGWVDSTDPVNPSKTLAAELMRGVGGVLINKKGERFCNELGTRAYVTDKMLAHDAEYAETGVWNKETSIPTFSLVLSSSAALDGKKHVDLYSHKGLMTKLEGISALAEWMRIDVNTLRNTMVEYQLDALGGKDKWGKVSFRGVPATDLDNETFYVGSVTPVLHYCMGGITIDTEGNVLNEHNEIIEGLHAAGEVTGGVHGDNRLGGNSLLECTVFGTIVGKKLPVRKTSTTIASQDASTTKRKDTQKEERKISQTELEQHNIDGDCWVSINGVVYDLTEFADEHPAGPESIRLLAGQDGSEAFNAVHNEDILSDFEEERLGILAEAEKTVTAAELEEHNNEGDCWVAINGVVYDLTEFAEEHPGGIETIHELAGQDGSEAFNAIHSEDVLDEFKIGNERIGVLV